MRQLEATNPPRASLLVTIALVTEELDEQTAELFARALEAEDYNTREQAVVAISLVPASVFVPALQAAIAREDSDRVRAMLENVLGMCGA